MVRAGNDNLLLAVGEAIEALLRPTPPPPPPTCTGCEPIAGKCHFIFLLLITIAPFLAKRQGLYVPTREER